MLRLFFVVGLILILNDLTGQVFWSEDFGTGPGCETLLVGDYSSPNGDWTVAETGVNTNDNNVWYVSPAEAGMGEGNCGDGCTPGNPNLENNTLHVSNGTVGDNGAAYAETGFGLTDSDLRAESPTIDCSNRTSIAVDFLYLTAGAPPNDICVLQYFDGAAWSDIGTLAPTPVGCPGGQGEWTAISFNLPASADLNPNVKIGYRWINVDDGDATDPSVAIDDIEISGTPDVVEEIFADFSASMTDICVGDCIDFTDESTGDGIDTWEWEFENAETTLSPDQNPTDICYSSAGTFSVTLSISSADDTDELTMDGFITVDECGSPPEAAFSASETDICVGDCIDFTDESTGTGITDWEWTFDGAETTASTDQNPAGICYETAGSYSVTLLVTNADGDDEVIVTDFVVVDECSEPPVADFTSNIQDICVGDCIDFSDLSTGTDIQDWEWTFEGADTPMSMDQNPSDICYATAGVYDVTLSVTNSEGTDEVTLDDYITVTACAGPSAAFSASDTTICVGDCIDFIDQSIGGATTYDWTFAGADTPTSADQNPVDICYSTVGQYDVTLNVSDGVLNDDSTRVSYITVEECPIDFPELSIDASATVICVGDCISFTDESANDSISGWIWTFDGGDPPAAFEQDPQEVCYLNEGSYDVTLETIFQGELLDSTFSNFITVLDTCGPVANFNYTPIVCLGQCYDFENTSTGGESYFWTFEGAATPTSEEENPFDICYLDETGIFDVTLTVVDEFGSSTSITQQITVVPPSSVNAGPDQTITQGTTTVLSGSAGNGTGEYLWQPFEDVSCFDCPSTQTIPLQSTTTFILYYEESGGCTSSDTVTVFVNEVTSYGIPNSFSPNNDGVNDILYVRGNNITKLQLIIYNRYGQKVFETNSQSEGWDGTMNGKELNAGVFGYYLEASFLDGTSSSEKGDITLVR